MCERAALDSSPDLRVLEDDLPANTFSVSLECRELVDWTPNGFFLIDFLRLWPLAVSVDFEARPYVDCFYC